MQRSMLKMSKQNEGYEIQSWAWITKLPSKTGPENLMIFKLGKNLMGVLQIPLAPGQKRHPNWWTLCFTCRAHWWALTKTFRHPPLPHNLQAHQCTAKCVAAQPPSICIMGPWFVTPVAPFSVVKSSSPISCLVLTTIFVWWPKRPKIDVPTVDSKSACKPVWNPAGWWTNRTWSRSERRPLSRRI